MVLRTGLCLILCLFQLKATFGQEKGKTMQVATDILIEKAKKLVNQYPDSSFSYSKQALLLAKEHDYATGEAQVHQLLGDIFYHQAAYEQALNHYFAAAEHYRKHRMHPPLASCYHRMGIIYYASKQPDLALNHQLKAHHLYSQLSDSLGIARILGSIGHLYEKKQQYDSAFYYQNRALSIYKHLEDTSGIAKIMENIGSVHEDKEDYENAFIYFTQAYNFNTLQGNQYELLSNLNNIGDVYRKTSHYDKALIFTQRALDLAYTLDEKNQISSALRDLGKTYHALKNDSLAFRYLNEGRELYEKIYTEESAKQIALLQTLFEIERKNNEILLLEQEQQLSNFTKIVAVAGGFLVVILAITIISRQRFKIRKNRELIDEKEKAYQAERLSMKLELDNKKLSEQRLQDELMGKSKELTTHTLHTITKNQILEELKEDILRILKDDARGHKKELKKIVKKIDLNFQRDNDWEDFRNIFDKVHESFFEKLNEKHPELTSKDKRLAALIKLNMNSEDIVTTLAISSDSLRIARYRLRKKMCLAKEEKLSNYIQGL